MPVLEINKQINAMIGIELKDLADIESKDDWVPPIPSFQFLEHKRIIDMFFRPMAKTLTGNIVLSRCIQVIHNLVTLCGLRELLKCGPRLDWSKFEVDIASDRDGSRTTDLLDNMKSEISPLAEDLTFPTDEYM